TLTATAAGSGITGNPVTFTAEGTAGAPGRLAFTTAPSSAAQSGVALAQQPALQVQDANGNPVSQSGDQVTATIASGPAGATLTATAAGSGISGNPVTFTAEGTAGAPTRLALTTEPSSGAQSGVALAQQPAVQVQDANGNPVSQSGDQVTATIASGPAGATLSNATATTGS